MYPRKGILTEKGKRKMKTTTKKLDHHTQIIPTKFDTRHLYP